jgi:phospholipid-binding lipoprotein MlaA
MRAGPLLALCALSSLLGACAHTPADDPADPLETVNRGIYVFNEKADHYGLRPVAKGYDTVMPDVARQGVRNFLSNLFYPTVVVNDLLQAKGTQGAQDLCRFVINTTVGLGGLFDVATRGGLTANDEDFGQTLGYWGVGPGWYLMIPFLGPSDNRDFVGRVVDYGSNPLVYVNEPVASYGISALNAVDTRAGLLSADKFMAQQMDRYVFVRSIYLQNRNAKVYDGNPPKEDYGVEEDNSPAPAAQPATPGEAVPETATPPPTQ